MEFEEKYKEMFKKIDKKLCKEGYNAISYIAIKDYAVRKNDILEMICIVNILMFFEIFFTKSNELQKIQLTILKRDFEIYAQKQFLEHIGEKEKAEEIFEEYKRKRNAYVKDNEIKLKLIDSLIPTDKPVGLSNNP